MSMKIATIPPSRIEPPNFQLVAQCAIQLHHRVRPPQMSPSYGIGVRYAIAGVYITVVVLRVGRSSYDGLHEGEPLSMKCNAIFYSPSFVCLASVSSPRHLGFVVELIVSVLANSMENSVSAARRFKNHDGNRSFIRILYPKPDQSCPRPHSSPYTVRCLKLYLCYALFFQNSIRISHLFPYRLIIHLHGVITPEGCNHEENYVLDA
jgi:hypothetical protein